MRRFVPALFAVTLIASAPVPALADDTAADVRQEFNQTVDALKAYTAEQRDEFVTAAEDALDDMDRRIEILEDRIDETYVDVRDETRRQWKETLRELRKKRADLAVWYGGVKEGSAEAWPRLKKGFRDAYEDIADAYHDAIDGFEDEPATKDEKG